MMKPKFHPKWFFLLPTIIFLLVLTIFPLIWSLSLCFCNWKLTKAGGESIPEFVGFANFIKIFTKDERFWSDLLFTVMYVGISTTLELAIGLGLALMLTQRFRGRGFFRVMYIMPMACPPLGAAFMWRMLLHEDVGLINRVLTTLGLGNVRWMTEPWAARFGIILVDVWEWTPFMFLALLAALQALPIEPYESAMIDGASGWQIFRHMTVPLLTPIIVTLVLIRSIDCFKLFDLVYGITGGGPGLSTESLSYYIYLIGRTYFDLGYASATSYLLLIIMLALSMTLIKRLGKMSET